MAALSGCGNLLRLARVGKLQSYHLPLGDE